MHFVLSFISLGFASFQSRGRCTDCSHLELVFDLTILFYKNFFLLFLKTPRQSPARMHFPFSAPSRMHFSRESHILENITAQLSPTPSILALFNLFQNFHDISKSSYHRGHINFHSLLIVSCFPNLLFFPRKYS